MDSQERKIIDELFDKLGQAEQQAGPREPAAEAHIRSRIERQPGAPYLMAQTIVMQQQALEAAQVRLTTLEDELTRRPASGGFLSGLFGGGASDRSTGAARSASPSTSGGRLPGQGVAQAGFGQGGAGFGRDAAGFGRSGAGFGRGGGFLAGAAQTAMGVAGGMLLGSMIGSAFGGGEAHAAQPAAPEPAAADDAGNEAGNAGGNAGDDGFGAGAGDGAMDFGDEEI